MPCRDADGGMDQLMREDGRDLRWHGVRRVRQVGPDEVRGDKQDENAATIKMRIGCWCGDEGRRA